jgi:quercetin dioxygenase-like cupin family protein
MAIKTKLTALMAAAIALTACSASTTVATNPDALAHGAAVKTLDAGKLTSLPTGSIYVRMIRFAQPVGYVIHSKQHVSSVIYVEVGVHRLTLDGQAPVDLVAGQAFFHQSVAHTHENPGPGPSVWYSIALWPSSARGTALVDKVARAAFESGDIARDTWPQGAYSQVLRQVTLANLGTSGAHRFGGLSALYVLSGSVTIKNAHSAPLTLSTGQGVDFLPDVALQETNAGQSPAVYLEFITTAVGKDFEVPLQQPPAP